MNAEAGAGSGVVAAEPVTPGGLLRTQRKRRGFSVQRAAEDLHLDVWLVEAIEDNRFEALGAPVYAKGHLRKYATLLGLSPATVIELYEGLSGTPSEPLPIPAAIASPVRPERRRSSKLPWWIAAAIAAAGLAWLVFELLSGGDMDIGTISSELLARPHPSPPPSNGGGGGAPSAARSAGGDEVLSVPRPATEVAGRNEVPSVPRLAAEGAGEDKVLSFPRSAAEGQGGGTEPAAEKPAAGAVRVRLEFSEPSWTEIYDGAGNRLMFDMGMPGRTHTIVGVPPLRVTVGFASAVSVRVGERPIAIPRRAGRDAARFLIEADGSVRMDRSMKTAQREAIE